DSDVPQWVSENESLQYILSGMGKGVSYKPNSEDKKIEKLLKKTSREIYKLRKSRKKQPDITSFREKWLFLHWVDMAVPLLPADISIDANLGKKENTQLRPPHSQSADKNSQQRFEYVVDPELGVQV
ncbi:protein kibra, partial [Caerostris extrusa]